LYVSVAVVVGNPKPQSRTLTAAIGVATKLTGSAPDIVIDCVTLGAGLIGWGDPDVAAAVKSVQDADLVVFASPTYKATYTGLLKLFLDQVPSNGLAGVVAIPLMLGAAMHHAMAPEYLLKPVLVELGGTCPVRGLYLLDSDYEDNDALTTWLEVAKKFVPSGAQA
jgi:FMN reductase